jgi:hypothetical protein
VDLSPANTFLTKERTASTWSMAFDCPVVENADNGLVSATGPYTSNTGPHSATVQIFRYRFRKKCKLIYYQGPIFRLKGV